MDAIATTMAETLSVDLYATVETEIKNGDQKRRSGRTSDASFNGGSINDREIVDGRDEGEIRTQETHRQEAERKVMKVEL